MGLGWRGAGTLGKRTEGSWYLLVTLLLFCVLWRAHTQTDDGKSLYFWETGKALIRGEMCYFTRRVFVMLCGDVVLLWYVTSHTQRQADPITCVCALRSFQILFYNSDQMLFFPQSCK